MYLRVPICFMVLIFTIVLLFIPRIVLPAETTASIEGQVLYLTCWSNKADEVMTEAVVALLEGNAQRRYRTLKMEGAAAGTVIVDFGTTATAYRIDGVRLRCKFRMPPLPAEKLTAHAVDQPLLSPIAVPIGGSARLQAIISGDPAAGTRKVTVPVPIR